MSLRRCPVKAYVYNWCSHFSDQEWMYVIIFAADRAAANKFARESSEELCSLLDDESLASVWKLVVSEEEIKPGVLRWLVANQ